MSIKVSHSLSIYVRAIALLLIFFVVLSASAQELKGKILNEKNEPIFDAHIQLIREGVVKGSTKSNHHGNYIFFPIGLGYYQVLITVKGYDKLIQRIEIRQPGTLAMDFALKVKKKRKTEG